MYQPMIGKCHKCDRELIGAETCPCLTPAGLEICKREEALDNRHSRTGSCQEVGYLAMNGVGHLFFSQWHNKYLTYLRVKVPPETVTDDVQNAMERSHG